MNKEIVTVGSNALVFEQEENQLGKDASMIELRARQVSISNDEEFAAASKLATMVKQMQKKVDGYWEPMRVKAKSAYDEVLAHKKAMMTPLKSAESILRGKLDTYSHEKEMERQVREEEMRRLAAQEMERKLEEAAIAEKRGDAVSAEFAMAEAEVMENVAISGRIQKQPPKASGISQVKTWEITEVDSSLVPFFLKAPSSGP